MRRCSGGRTAAATSCGKGAFAESLKRAGEVPLLLQHKAGRPLGRIEHLSEDKRGLRVIARLEAARRGGLARCCRAGSWMG